MDNTQQKSPERASSGQEKDIKHDVLYSDKNSPESQAIAERVAERRAFFDNEPEPKSEPAPENKYFLQSANDVSQMLDLKWIVKGILPAEGLGAIYGASRSGKSFVALDLLFSVSQGLVWFGYKTQITPVIYISLEGEAGLKNRLKALRFTKGVLPENVHFIIRQPFNLMNKDDIDELAQIIPPKALVIVDTLNRAAPYADENSSRDMGKILSNCKILQSKIGGLVLLISHTGKDAQKGVRGHSSLIAALDSAILVNRNNELRSWQVDKSKDGLDGQSHQFKLELVELGENSDGEAITSCVVSLENLPKEQAAKGLSTGAIIALDSYKIASETKGILDNNNVFAGLNLEDWRQVFYAQSTQDNVNAKKTAFSRARTALINKGLLTVKNDVYSLTETTSLAEIKIISQKLIAYWHTAQNGTSTAHVPLHQQPETAHTAQHPLGCVSCADEWTKEKYNSSANPARKKYKQGVTIDV